MWLQKLYSTPAFQAEGGRGNSAGRNNGEHVREYGTGNADNELGEDPLYTRTSGGGLPPSTLPSSRLSTAANHRSYNISQLDGEDNEETEEEDEEEDEDGLGSDLDDDDEEQVDGVDTTNNRMLCQFERVNRSRNKWKCILTDGIASIDGQEYVFHKAQCDFEF